MYICICRSDPRKTSSDINIYQCFFVLYITREHFNTVLTLQNRNHLLLHLVIDKYVKCWTYILCIYDFRQTVHLTYTEQFSSSLLKLL